MGEDVDLDNPYHQKLLSKVISERIDKKFVARLTVAGDSHVRAMEVALWIREEENKGDENGPIYELVLDNMLDIAIDNHDEKMLKKTYLKFMTEHGKDIDSWIFKNRQASPDPACEKPGPRV